MYEFWFVTSNNGVLIKTSRFEKLSGELIDVHFANVVFHVLFLPPWHLLVCLKSFGLRHRGILIYIFDLILMQMFVFFLRVVKLSQFSCL